MSSHISASLPPPLNLNPDLLNFPNFLVSCPKMGSSPSKLCAAAESGDLDALRTRLDAGDDPNAEDGTRHHWRPLHYAAYADKPDCIALLIERGALPDEQTTSGWFSGQQAPVHIAADSGHASSIAALLSGGADPESSDQNKWTALHYAARATKGKDCLEVLLGRGANPDLLNSGDETALDLAMKADATENARLLLRFCNSDSVLRAFNSAIGLLNSSWCSMVTADAPEHILPTERLIEARRKLADSSREAQAKIATDERQLAELDRSIQQLTLSAMAISDSSLSSLARRADIARKAELTSERTKPLRANLSAERDQDRRRRDVMDVLDETILRRRERERGGLGLAASVAASSAGRQRSRSPRTLTTAPSAPSVDDLEAVGTDFELLDAVPATEDNTCPVCLTVEKNAAIVPCGHLICFDCGRMCRANGDGLCPICRQRIQNVMRVFG
jgi:hypothetical protein